MLTRCWPYVVQMLTTLQHDMDRSKGAAWSSPNRIVRNAHTNDPTSDLTCVGFLWALLTWRQIAPTDENIHTSIICSADIWLTAVGHYVTRPVRPAFVESLHTILSKSCRYECSRSSKYSNKGRMHAAVESLHEIVLKMSRIILSSILTRVDTLTHVECPHAGIILHCLGAICANGSLCGSFEFRHMLKVSTFTP